jgi:GDP-L-fucose synthase
LLERGDEVHVVDPIVPGTGGLPLFEWPLFNPGKYNNGPTRFVLYPNDCRSWFRYNYDLHFDYAFHLAAIVGGREMIENNPLSVADDLSIDAAYWQWAAIARPGKSVIFSSSAAYPIHLQRAYVQGPLRERDISFTLGCGTIGSFTLGCGTIGVPDLTYGWSKLTMEYLARLAYEKHGLKSICFRPFSGYGEDQDMAYPFPSLCKKVLDYKDHPAVPVEVWGTGEQMRDFIYIEDCIDGVLTMMDKIDDGSAVNLSTGVATSFNDIIRLASEVAGYAIVPQIRPLSDKPVGVFCRVGDTSKQRSLGFTPKVSLREGVSRVVSYLGTLREECRR